jgi:hypothetical protein
MIANPTAEPINVNPRLPDARKGSDQTEGETNGPPFEGVLAGVATAQPTQSTAQPAQGSTQPTQNLTASTQLPAPLNPVATVLAQDVPETTAPAAAPAEDPMSGLMKLLSGSDTNPTSVAAAGAAQTIGQATAGTTNTVSTLLKRVGKDKDADKADAAPAAATAAPSTDLLAILSPGLVQAPRSAATLSSNNASSGSASAASAIAGTTAAAGSNGSADEVRLVAGTASDAVDPNGAGSANPQGQAAQDSMEAGVTAGMLATPVTNIAVETHLAPMPQLMVKPENTAAHAATFGTALETVQAHGLASDAQSSIEVGSASMGVSMPLSPTRSITAAISQLAAAAPTAAPNTAITAPASSTPGVARTMTLQMAPPDLGLVNIRLHVTGQTLDVQLSFSNPETTGMIARERDNLTVALQNQDYQVNSLVIQDSSATSAGQNSAGQNAPGQNGASGGGTLADHQASNQNAGGQSGGREAGEQRNQPYYRSPQETNEPPPNLPAVHTLDPAGRSLFI